MAAVAEFRRPESVLVVVHTPTLDCLLLERVEPRGFWQSVTGTLRWAETPAECAARELARRDGPRAARLARRARAALVSDLAGVALALCARRRQQRRASVVSRGARGACRAHRADGARRVSLAARRRRDRAGRVVDESRGTAATQGFAARVISVVTVHGLWMRGAAMAVLRRRLEPHGFQVHDFTYPSVTGSLTANAAALAEFVDDVPGDTVHLVGHSLGGVLICAMLENAMPARIGRVVCSARRSGAAVPQRVLRVGRAGDAWSAVVSPTCMRAAGSPRGAPASRSAASRAAYRSASAACSARSRSRTTARSRSRRRGSPAWPTTSCCPCRTSRCCGRRPSPRRPSTFCCTGDSGAQPRRDISAPAGAGTEPSRPRASRGIARTRDARGHVSNATASTCGRS